MYSVHFILQWFLLYEFISCVCSYSRLVVFVHSCDFGVHSCYVFYMTIVLLVGSCSISSCLWFIRFSFCVSATHFYCDVTLIVSYIFWLVGIVVMVAFFLFFRLICLICSCLNYLLIGSKLHLRVCAHHSLLWWTRCHHSCIDPVHISKPMQYMSMFQIDIGAMCN